MELYDFMMDSVQNTFTVAKTLKDSPRSRVWLLAHKETGKPFIFRQFVGDSSVYHKLLTISCPNLPQVMEVAEKDGTVAVLEEYIQGETVAELLQGALFTPREVRQIIGQLCSGLWILHSMGAVHRDIKPENVILRETGAVLIDFDASRIYKETQENDTKVLGTTGYAAPEQYGISQTDGRADIYSLGVLMNVMLTGKHPATVLADGRMGRVILRCTMMNPEKRFQTIRHLMDAL
jgi:serine/threonine protein kinase